MLAFCETEFPYSKLFGTRYNPQTDKVPIVPSQFAFIPSATAHAASVPADTFSSLSTLVDAGTAPNVNSLAPTPEISGHVKPCVSFPLLFITY